MSLLSRKGSLPVASLLLPLTALVPNVLAADAADVVAMEAGPWIVTTTSPIPDSVGLIDANDATLVRVEPGASPFVQTSMSSWFAMTGFEPSDIDGIAFRPGKLAPGHRGALAFSLLTNEAGFRDGDVLGISPAGSAEVLVSEDALLGILGVPMGSIDVDALAYDDSGRLLFSLQGFLGGTVVGDVENGDILRVEPDGGLSRVYTEDEVQGAFTLATGLGDSIGDVHGLEFLGGNVYVAIQGPSDVDGGMLRLGPDPAILFPEADLGLAGAELDGIAYLGDSAPWPTVSLDKVMAAPGSVVRGEGSGFSPGAPVLVLFGGTQAMGQDYGLGGFGEVFMNPMDPWLTALIQVGGLPILHADGEGKFGVDFDLSAAEFGGMWMGGTGWSFQALDLANLCLTAPVRIGVQ